MSVTQYLFTQEPLATMIVVTIVFEWLADPASKLVQRVKPILMASDVSTGLTLLTTFLWPF